jgi:hypothetical protein
VPPRAAAHTCRSGRIALAQAVPPADWVICRAAPCLDGAFLGRLLFVCRAQVDPVTLLHKPGVKIVEASQLIPQLGGSDLTKQCGRFGSLIRPHGVGRSAGRRAEFPWLVSGSCGHAANSGRSCGIARGRADRFDACDAKQPLGSRIGAVVVTSVRGDAPVMKRYTAEPVGQRATRSSRLASRGDERHQGIGHDLVDLGPSR